jgi:hypothetical protein
MTRLTRGFYRLIVAILVTEFTGHVLMRVVDLVFGMHVMFEEQVVSLPSRGFMAFLAV